MTENKRYYRDFEGENGTILRDRITNEEVFEFGLSDSKDLCDLLNEQEETIKKQNQEILSCHDTLVTIEALCDAVLNHDFEGVVSKVDFCNMLIEMDNKDLAFLKDCFEAIKDNDLKTMTSLTVECKYGGDVNG